MLTFALIFLLPLLASAAPHNHRRTCSASNRNSTGLDLGRHHRLHYKNLTTSTSVTSQIVATSTTTIALQSSISVSGTASGEEMAALAQATTSMNAQPPTVPPTVAAGPSESLDAVAALGQGGGQASHSHLQLTTTTTTATPTTTVTTTTKPITTSSSSPVVSTTPTTHANTETTAPSPPTTTPTSSTTKSAVSPPASLTAAPTSPAGGGGSAGGPVGLGWNGQSGTKVNTFANAPGSKLSWYYDWALTPTSGVSGLEFVPQVWGSGSVAGVAGAAKSWPAGVDYVLSFNERKFSAISASPSLLFRHPSSL